MIILGMEPGRSKRGSRLSLCIEAILLGFVTAAGLPKTIMCVWIWGRSEELDMDTKRDNRQSDGRYVPALHPTGTDHKKRYVTSSLLVGSPLITTGTAPRAPEAAPYLTESRYGRQELKSLGHSKVPSVCTKNVDPK
jgi:hypothetical protein